MKLDELMAQLEAAETVDEIKAAAEAIEQEKSRQSAVAEKKALLDSFKGEEKEAKQVTQAKTLGDFAVKNLDLSDMLSGRSKHAGTGYGFKAYTDAEEAPQVADESRVVVDNAYFGPSIRDLFGKENISGNALSFYVLGATEKADGGAPAVVAQGATKPQMHMPFEKKTVTLDKVAGWWYETDEFISDVPYIRSAVDNRGMQELAKAANSYLASELLNTSGIQDVAYSGLALSPDDVFNAMMAIKTATGYDADAILINPQDYADFRLAKDGVNQYYGGGYFYAPYANGTLALQPGIWGLQTIVTTDVAQGEPVVGAFRAGASVLTKAGEGAGLEVHRGDHDDAINNRVTVVVEERLGLAVRVPAAFALISAGSE